MKSLVESILGNNNAGIEAMVKDWVRSLGTDEVPEYLDTMKLDNKGRFMEAFPDLQYSYTKPHDEIHVPDYIAFSDVYKASQRLYLPLTIPFDIYNDATRLPKRVEGVGVLFMLNSDTQNIIKGVKMTIADTGNRARDVSFCGDVNVVTGPAKRYNLTIKKCVFNMGVNDTINMQNTTIMPEDIKNCHIGWGRTFTFFNTPLSDMLQRVIGRMIDKQRQSGHPDFEDYEKFITCKPGSEIANYLDDVFSSQSEIQFFQYKEGKFYERNPKTKEWTVPVK